MTENEVIVMLAEAIDQDKEYKSWHVSTKHLMIFAAMVQKVEREACAKVCDARAIEYDGFTEEENASEKLAAAIRARGQEQEPVAHWSDCAVHSEPAYPKGECDCGGFSAPPQHTWVGLTDEDRLILWLKTESEDVDRYDFARAIESKLKEKNT